MPWSLAADGFYDYTPTVNFGGKTTKIYYVAEGGSNTTGTANDITKPFRTLPQTREFTLSPSGSATRGARYQDLVNGGDYYVVDTISGGSSIVMIDNNYSVTPPSGGTLEKASGMGDAHLTIVGTGTVRQGAIGQWNIDRGGSGHDTGLNYPDWILLRRGDTFERQSFDCRMGDGSVNLRGPGYTAPFIIGCYDHTITANDSSWGTASGNSGDYCTVNPANSSRARPIVSANAFSAGSSTWFYVTDSPLNYGLNNGGNNIVIVGIEALGDGGQAFVWNAKQPNSFFRVEDCYIHSNWGAPIKGNLQAHRCIMTDGQILEGNGPPPIYYDLNGLGSLNSYKECMLDSATGDGGGSHLVYGGADATPWFGIDPGGMDFNGCIFSRATNHGECQYRAGGTVNNNLIIKCNATNEFFKTGVTGNRTTTFSNNVRIHCGSGQLVAAYGGSSGVTYISNDLNQGPVAIDNNIDCHESTASSICIEIPRAARDWAISNNLFYDVCTAGTNSDVIKFNGGVSGGAIIRDATISSGSGYTDKTINISSLTWTTGTIDTGVFIYIPTIGLSSTTSWPWTTGLHTREGWIVLGGFTGAYTVLNGKVCRVLATDGTITPVQLQGNFPEFASLPTYNNATHAGKVYLPYLGRYLRNTGSSAGEALRADIYPYNGAIVFVGWGTDADNGNEQIGTGQSGSGYVVGDIVDCTGNIYVFALTAGTPVLHKTYTNNGQSFVYLYNNSGSEVFRGTGAPAASGTLTGIGTPNLTFSSNSHVVDSGSVDMGTVPGGSGFSLTLTKVGSSTGVYNTNGNVADTTKATAASYLAPERTAGTYYDLIANTTGSDDDTFCNACLGQSRQHWNRLLMAESFNDYIRQGFGKAMLGSAYATQFGSGTTTPPPSKKKHQKQVHYYYQ